MLDVKLHTSETITARSSMPSLPHISYTPCNNKHHMRYVIGNGVMKSSVRSGRMMKTVVVLGGVVKTGDENACRGGD